MKNNKKNKKINKLVLLAFFTSISLTIFMLESMLPTVVPIPGVKLGLANVVTLFLILNADKRSAPAVLLVRIVLASIFGGQILSFFYSLAGGVLCFVTMSITNIIIKGKPVWFISVMGAIFHNIGQITVAVLVLSWSIVFYLPFLLISGCIAGFATGLIVDFTCKRMEKLGVLSKFRAALGK